MIQFLILYIASPKCSTKLLPKEDDISDVARFMPRVYEDDDVDVGNDDLDASNEEEVNVKEEEEIEESKVAEQPTVVAKRSKNKRVEEEELRPEEQVGRSKRECVTHSKWIMEWAVGSCLIHFPVLILENTWDQ